MDGKGDLHSQDHPLPRGVCAHQAREEELIRFTTFIVTTYVEPWMSAHCSTSAPATDLALLKALAAYRDKEIGRASGKVMARHMWYVSEELVGLSLFDEATVVEEKRAIVSAMQQRLGRRTRLAAPTSPSTQWSSAPWRRLRRPTLSASSPPSGPVTISSTSIRPSGREGRLHHGSSARPSPTGGERLCGEGRRPHQRVLRRHHARRGTATAPSAGRGAPPGVVPVREIGIGWRARPQPTPTTYPSYSYNLNSTSSSFPNNSNFSPSYSYNLNSTPSSSYHPQPTSSFPSKSSTTSHTSPNPNPTFPSSTTNLK
ncbi:hypothetical protein GWK47_008414 [Chionoecetes opilio]|uniref:Uncharacterized protein n=1 Tax=Chionoecetes opilio TaxID=41210 RepID=A0A8J4Y451_CHIOP|nr:hypothetical protein GWK47_008414 [Chionoecetes opilio]